jgi:hypothetical protein
MSGIFIFFLLAANGNHCQDFMEFQALSMIAFRNGNLAVVLTWECLLEHQYYNSK